MALRSFIILGLVYTLLCIRITLAAPALSSTNLIKRQGAGAPITVVTVNTIQSSSGPVTETCTVTLTPITVNGQEEFREEKSCTQAQASSNNNNSPSVSPGDATNTPPSPTQQATDSNASNQTLEPTDSVSQQTFSISPTTATASISDSATATISSGATVPTDVQVIGVSSIATDVQASSSVITGPASSSNSPSGVISGPAIASPTSLGSNPTDVSVLGSSIMPSASASAAAALRSSSTESAPSTNGTSAAFAIPGKSIQVLPIGLGVFAGVSVVALIIVGLVTYERTKYRRKFRKEKLAENAAPMGYGGMAEVR